LSAVSGEGVEGGVGDLGEVKRNEG